jgi:L-amino acid N-acyltransferase YncA
VIARPYQNQGLGRVLLSELFQEATRQKVEILLGAVTAEQQAALRILQGLGFRREAVLRDQRRTLRGELHDVQLMTANIREAWARMEDLMREMDGYGRERHPRARS